MAGLWDLLNPQLTGSTRNFPGRSYVIQFMARVALGEITGAQAVDQINEIMRHDGPPASVLVADGMTQPEADAAVAARELTALEMADLSAIYATITGNTTQKLVAMHRIHSALEMTELTNSHDAGGDNGNGWGGLSPATYSEVTWRAALGIPDPV